MKRTRTLGSKVGPYEGGRPWTAPTLRVPGIEPAGVPRDWGPDGVAEGGKPE